MLLLIALISVGALWILARFRFPDRPATPNPVPPVLTQLGLRSALDDVAATISDLTPRIAASLVVVEAPPPVGESHARILPALRLNTDLAIMLLDDVAAQLAEGGPLAASIKAYDPLSGLTVIGAPAADVPGLATWAPRRIESSRYVFGTDVSREGTALRPIFLGALYDLASPLWDPPTVWAVPPGTGLDIGTFLFTAEGALVGLVIEREGRPAIVPGGTLMTTAERLLSDGMRQVGRIGVDVQALSPAVTSVTGAGTGVIITWVDPEGPAANQLKVADVIETIADRALETPEQWQAQVGRLAPGETVLLRVRRNRTVQDVSLTAGPPLTPSTPPELGLTTREVRGTGTEVLRVEPGSAAARAGIVPGDIITFIGGIDAPTPVLVSRTFTRAPPEQPLLVAVTRNGTRHILVLQNR
jgi:membrane-associated protease RseP (regulator of RpoE activity)